jgi:alpha-glucosidase
VKTKTFWLVVGLWLVALGVAQAEVQRVKFSAGAQYLVVEVLNDHVVHFELSAFGPGPEPGASLHVSPMVAKTDYPGPSTFSHTGNRIETAAFEVEVDSDKLCVAVRYKITQRPLTTVCPQDLASDWKGLSISKDQTENVYGLGQQFKALGSADGDWFAHKVREEQPSGQAQAHGNGFMSFYSGMVGNVQFPVMYALGSGRLNYVLFLDNVYKQRWDFSGDPWQVRMWGDQVRFYVIAGDDLPQLRSRYLELTGRPPVPPRKAFGLWVSEFGYKNWPQIDTLLAGLRADRFPLDGFVLDLQWFGGVIANNPDSAMGRLDWDRANFTDPDAKIAAYRNDHVGLTAIEESYVNENTDTFTAMRGAGNMFAYQPSGNQCNGASAAPVILRDWFGQAAMVDWSSHGAGAWVHDQRRFPNLVQKGITSHWTDLGEPEKYDGNACYTGVEVTAAGPKDRHGDIHNLYAFLWNRSIWNGYFRQRAANKLRPFVLSRSGAPGSQRWGVAMWSGDIGSRLDILATHLNAQMHMSFSGIDFYGSDIGGFRREGMPANCRTCGNLQYQNELYSQWLADGAWFDVPVRPHTDNTFQQDQRYETAPNLVGMVDSNRDNLRQRYELIPYYYSLAYRAHLFGEPVIPPLVFYHQDDPNVRAIGHEKMVGKDLLVGAVASHGEYARNVYLPQGRWINYHTRDWFDSTGQWVNGFPTYIDGTLRLPVFARAGAILPMMHVDDQTKDAFGHRKDGTKRNELIVQVYADAAPSEFTLYEDDGSTLDYTPDERPAYRTRTTRIVQRLTGNTATVTIQVAQGSYTGALAKRNNVVRLVVRDARATRVTLNGTALPQRTSIAKFERYTTGWYNAGRNLILVKTGNVAVSAGKTIAATLQPVAPATTVNFVCDNGWSAPGDTVYAVGGIPQLGNWTPANGVKLAPSIYYEYIYNPPPGNNLPGPKTPKWTGVARDLPAGQQVEWKCAKKLGSGQWQWQPGGNNSVMLPASGFAGTVVGAF